MPTRGSEYAAAWDVYVPQDYELKVGRQVIPLGFRVELPTGWKANIRPRSGFSAKGMTAEVRTTYRQPDGATYVAVQEMNIDADVLFGLCDSDYRGIYGAIVKVYNLDVVAPQRGEFHVMVENHVFLTKHTRVAQMEILKSDEHELIEVDDIDYSIDRGGGYGHTGK